MCQNYRVKTMPKLPTTFQTLDLTGFEFDRAQQYTGINREMVDFACAVLQKNRVGVVVRSVNAALKEIYGIGGSTDVICKLVREWRTENLSLMRQGKSEKDLASALLEAADDGLLEESEVPEEFLTVSRQMAIAAFRLAFQKADTSVSGDRMKQLAQQNEILQKQLQAYPKLEMELDFYKSEYERQRNELKEAYMNLNKQQLADSEQFRHQLDSIQAERNELQAKLIVAERRLAEVAEFEAAARDRISEISKLNGQIDAREREVSTLHAQIQLLQTQIGEKQILESQLEQLRGQLKEASSTITNLQSQQKVSGALEVDVDPDQATDADLMVENETLHADLSDALKEIEDLKARLAQTESQAESQSQPVSEPVAEFVAEFVGPDLNSDSLEPVNERVNEPVPKNKKQKVAVSR
jgi:DNA repair exonuclease SbcCD ATPase subunit